MNKTQIETLFKAVKTDVELARLTEQGHYFSRAIEGLKRLKNVQLERNMDKLQIKTEVRRQWTLY